MEDGLSKTTAAAGAALLVVKKEKKERKPESGKRQGRRERTRERLAEEKAAKAAAEEKERLAAIQAQANQDLIATQAAARVVLLLKGEVFALPFGGLSPTLAASAGSSVSSDKPPRASSPAPSTPSPVVALHQVSRLGSREASPEISSVPLDPKPLDLNLIPSAGDGLSRGKSRSMAAKMTMPEARALMFNDDMPPTTPTDPAYFNDDVM